MSDRLDSLVDDSFTAAPLRATLSESVKENPDSRAKVLDLSNRTGIPAEAVADDVDGIDARVRLDNIDVEGLSVRSPVTGKFLGDYNNASIAHDDIDNLETIENNFLGKTFFDNFFPRQAENLNLALQTSNLLPSGLASLNERLKRQQVLERAANTETGSGFTQNPIIQQRRDSVGLLTETERDQLGQVSEKIQNDIIATEADIVSQIDDIVLTEAVIEGLTPEGLTPNQQAALSGLESVVQLAPSLAAGIGTALATKNPGAGTATTLSIMGTQVRGPEYWRAVQGGLNHDEALTFSAIKSGLEVSTELLPTGNLIKLARSPAGKRVFEFIINDMVGEQLNTLLGSIVDYDYGLDKEMEQAVATSRQAVIDLQLERQKSTAIATAVGAGAQAAVVGGTSKAISELTKESEQTQLKGAIEQENLDKVVEVVESSKLKERSPEAFRQFMQEASDEGVVYFDGPQVALYLQEQEDIDSDPVLSKLSEQVSEANITNGEIVIPVADFATDFVGSQHFESLRPHITLSADTISPFRQEVEADQTQSYVERMVQEASQNTSQYVENQAIFNNTVEQLVATGQVAPKVAKYMAEIVPAWATVMSRHTGQPVDELYAQVGLKIEGPFEDRKAALAEGANELGLILDQQDLGDVEIQNDKGQKVNAQRAFEQKQKQRTMVSKLLDCLNG